MDPSPMTFGLGSKRHMRDALASLRVAFDVVDGPAEHRSLVYLDTFDWRVYRRGLSLSVRALDEGKELALRRLDGWTRRRMTIEKTPAFAEDLPEGTFRDVLQPVITVRRLLPVAEAELDSQEFGIRDTRGRRVIRLLFTWGGATAPGNEGRKRLKPRLLVTGARRRSTYFSRITRHLQSVVGAARVEEGELDWVLAAIGRSPQDYSRWTEIVLDPRTRADAAMKRIHSVLLDTMRANEDGIRADLDSEFLHDFRVAGRRTRSALTQVKGVFSRKRVDRFRDEFRWLGDATNTLRDLDVFLIKLEGYQEGLSDEDREALKPLRKYVLRKRKKAHKKAVEELDSDRYRALKLDWARHLGKPVPGQPGGAKAGWPIKSLASKRIWSAYQRVMGEGQTLGPVATPESLHRLRIACKKLRYLLTFFRSLYPEEEMSKLLRALRELQENLGDFNDLVVHRKELAEYAAKLEKKEVGPETMRAMARLSRELKRRQKAERTLFAERFAAFASSANRAIYRRLFAPVK